MVKNANVRKERIQEQARKEAAERQAELAKMPMNAYMGKSTDLGKKIAKFMLSDFESVSDTMRKIKIFYTMLRDSKQHLSYLKSQLMMQSGRDVSLDAPLILDGDIKISISKAAVKILEEETRIQGCLKDIRTLVTQKLITMISTTEFTDAHFEAYVDHLQAVLKLDGYELFPEEYAMIPLI